MKFNKKNIMILIDIVIALLIMLVLIGNSKQNNIISAMKNKTATIASLETDLKFDLKASPEEKRVKAGETVEIMLSVEDINAGEVGLNSIVGILDYDESVFDSFVVEGIKNADLSDWNIELNTIENHELYGKFCIYTLEEGVTQNQDVVKITVKLKNDLEPQTTEIHFNNIESSDGNIAIEDSNKIVKLIICEDEVKDEIKDESIKTGDTVLLGSFIIMFNAIIVNIVVLCKNNKKKIILAVITLVIGITCSCIVAYAEELSITEIIAKTETLLNSEKYLVTDDDVSRIAPNTTLSKIQGKYNKSISVKNGTNTLLGNDKVATGMTLYAEDEKNGYTISVVGDLNKDGDSNQVELTSIIRNVIDNNKWNLNGVYKKSADMKLDGIINQNDIIASVRYIVYGELDIPPFNPVKAPSIEVINGTYDRDTNSYIDNITIKITENEQNAQKTVYKIQGATNTEYVEIENPGTFIIENPGTYKISSYTYGELWNRSEISTLIVSKQQPKYTVTIHHYEEGTTNKIVEDEIIVSNELCNFTVTNLSNESNEIIVNEEVLNIDRTYLDPNKCKYVSVERNEEKTTLGEGDSVSGMFTNTNQEIIYYYKLSTFQITGEVIGGNGVFKNDITETVKYGEESSIDIILQPTAGYTVDKLILYAEDEIDGTYGTEKDGGKILTNYKKNAKDEIIVPLFENVTKNLHLVAMFKESKYVAQIVAVPKGSEEYTNENGETILYNYYYTLEEAVADAKIANKNPGIVEIKVLANISGELIEIKESNNVKIDLNGYTISGDKSSKNENKGIFTVYDAKFVVIDKSDSQLGNIINNNSEGIGIYITIEGICTIGTNNKNISITSPTVEGGKYGVYKEKKESKEAILNFYDGKVIGGTTSFGGSTIVDDTPLLYYTYIDINDKNKQEAILARENGIEAYIGKTKYMTLEEAFEAVENNTAYTGETPIEIDVVSQVSVDPQSIKISENKNIILDLNGNTITTVTDLESEYIFYNLGKFEIKDSSLEPEEDVRYSELIKNNTYCFEKIDNHLEANNYGIDNSTANSYIEIDLTDKSVEDEVVLTVNANVSSEEGRDYGYLTIKNTTNAPALTDSEGRFACISGITIPKDYTKKLTGGSKYYLHLGYKKNENTNHYLDTFVINSITIDGKPVLDKLIKERGIINSTIGGLVYNSGDLVLSSGKIATNSSNPAIENHGNFRMIGGIISSESNSSNCIINYADGNEKKVEIKGGIIYKTDSNYAIINELNTMLVVDGYARIYNEIYNNGNLVVNKGMLKSIAIESSGKATLNEGIFVSDGRAIYIQGSCIINDADIRCYGTGSKGVAITNFGELDIYNVKIETYNIQATNIINSKNTAITNIYGGEYKSNYRWIYNETGKVNIYDAKYSGYEGINNNAETNLYGGSINSNTTGIINQKLGTINIGTKNTVDNDEVSITNPTIKAVGTGIMNSFGILNIYDGQIISEREKSIYGIISSIEETNKDGKQLDIIINNIIEDEAEYDRLILGVSNSHVAKISKTSTNLDFSNLTVNKDYTEQDGYYYFFKLNDAVNVCSKNSGDNITTIELTSNITTVKSVEILAGQNIRIDLNGKKIKYYGSNPDNDVFITNNSTVEIIDSKEDKGQIGVSGAIPIKNNGTMNLSVDIKREDTKSFSDPKNVTSKYITINNVGKLKVSGGTINATYFAIAIQNTNELIIDGGTINAYDSSYAINNTQSAKCYIKSGFVNAERIVSKNEESIAINNIDTAILNISGGEIRGYYYAIYNTSTYSQNGESTVEITGGSVKANSMYYMYSTGASKITIKNATFGVENNNCKIYTDIKNTELSIDDSTKIYGSIYACGARTKISNSEIIPSSQIYAITIGDKNSTSESEITNCKINNGAGIYKVDAGNLNINSCIINVSGTGVLNEGNGSITLNESTITSKTETVKNSGAGSITIPSECKTAITATNGSAVVNSNIGTVTIGTKGGTISEEYPKITGTKYGVQNTNASGILNFYDGIITGATKQSTSGTINDIEAGYDIIVIDNGDYTESAVLRKEVIAKVLKNSIKTSELNSVEYSEDGDYYTFYKIEDAVNLCIDNKKANIIIVRDLKYTDGADMETISNGKNIVLDLAGHTISIGKQNKFINNAKLEIVDNSIEKTGKLSFSNNKAIINNNELTLKNIIISNTYTNTGATNEFGGVIENTATMVVDGIIVEASVTKSAIFGNTNTGTLNIQNSQMKNLSYAAYTVIENKGQANITANDFQYVNIYNYDEGNIEISDINMLGGIKNYGTDIYEKGKSEPAIRIKSGNITTLYSRTIDYSTSNYDYPIENYSGEIIIEEDTDKTITIGPEGGTIKNNGGKITVNSGIVSQQITNNSGTIEINGGNITGRIMNEIDAIFNIYNGSINGSLGNAGIMNIGKDDVNISEISPMIILNNSLSNSKEGILGFYDGEIKITSASYVPVSGLVNDISDNSEIIYTIEDASSSYKLSKSTVVATIGDEKYYTLQSAFDACNTQEQKTIKLQKSVAVAEGSLYVIGVTQNIILDMNNNRIYGNCSNEIFTNEGTFEITDSTTGENAYITTNASGIILNKGKLKISGGIYTASKYGYSGGKQIVIQNKENGSIEMTGGKINVGGSYGAGRGYGIYSEYASGDIKVSGGIIECNNTTYAQYDSTAIYVYHSIMTLVEISGDAQLNNRAGGKPYQTFYTNGLNVTNANVTIKDNSIIKCRTNLIYNIDKPSTAKIEGGTITGTIQVQNSLGTLTVTGGTIGTLKSSGRTTNIQGGSITGTLSTGSNSATITGGTINCINAVDGDVVIKDNVEINTSVSAVTIDGANVTIKDNVSITSTESYGIVLKSGSLTLGEEEQPVKTESPAIKGKLNGVLVTKGIFKFYDGIISSTSTTAISGTVSDYPDLYAVTYTDSTNSTAILELISTKEEIISIGTSYYDNFNSAIEAIKNSGNKGTITVEKNITLDSQVVIPNGLNVTIDLNGYYIKYDNSSQAAFKVEQGATLTIVDSNENGSSTVTYSFIENTSGIAIENNGILNIGSDDSNTYENSPRIIGTPSGVTSGEGAVLNKYDGTIK